jgi:hypothetical protein
MTDGHLRGNWRRTLGLFLLLASCVVPIIGLIVPFLGLPAPLTATLTGVLLVGTPEALTVAAVVLLGRDVVTDLTRQAGRAVLSVVAARPVSRGRYYAGLTLVLVSIVPLYLYGYLPEIMPHGDFTRILLLACSDLAWIFGFVLMGGELWEKLGRIFVWEGSPPPPSR